MESPANRGESAHYTASTETDGEVSDGNWMPTGSVRFSLTLRLYIPGSVIVTNPACAALPALEA